VLLQGSAWNALSSVTAVLARLVGKYPDQTSNDFARSGRCDGNDGLGQFVAVEGGFDLAEPNRTAADADGPPAKASGSGRQR
jgi:hypothetical protein